MHGAGGAEHRGAPAGNPAIRHFSPAAERIGPLAERAAGGTGGAGERGIYWQSVYAALEEAGIQTYLVDARHVKQMPGRKTDVAGRERLAELARCGLLKASFVPPRDLRELRRLTRYRRKMSGYLAGEKNRL